MPNLQEKTTSDFDTTIPKLGPAKIPSRLGYGNLASGGEMVTLTLSEEEADVLGVHGRPMAFEKAGPCAKLYFDTSKVKCAVVTCGGLCPGINDVIRAVVMEACHHYHVASVTGIRYGLQGFIPKYGHDVVNLTPENVSNIHVIGGTALGSSRGPQAPDEIVDALERMNVNVLFMIGGDGTMKAAAGIVAELQKRNLRIGVIGIPKTIDNDINFVGQSFGFDTAVEKATEAIACAHAEANGANNGIGVVKLMGRESGFIAAQATLALKEVNYVLVPESAFQMDGPKGLLAQLETRLRTRHHAVIVVAEGAGQHLCEASGRTDISGNPVLCDICSLMIGRMKKYFQQREMEANIKFIDPSYIIRSVPANANDRVYCGFLGQNAVHAAMAGKTGMVVSRLQSRFVHVPLALVTMKRKKLNIASDYWRAVMESTGQDSLGQGNDAC